MDIFGMSWEDLPPEVRDSIEKKIDTNRMDADVQQHDFLNLINGLDEAQLIAFGSFIHILTHHDSSIGIYYGGVIDSVRSSKFGVCIACGKKHDEELQNMAKSGKTEPPGKSEGPHLHFEVNTSGSVTPVDDLGFDAVGTALVYTPVLTGDWPQSINHLPKSFVALLDTYNLDMIVDEYPAVQCCNCEMRYPSLEDRMLKDPDDCGGCHQKAKFG